MSVLSAYVGVLAVFMVIALAVCALMIVAYWWLFKKAGEPGWAAIVPFYNSFVLFKITWGNGWYFLLAIVPALICNVMQLCHIISFAEPFGSAGSGVLWSIYMLLLIVDCVFCIITLVKLAKVFGKGGGWACGLIFLSPIFLCIMAFSKDIMYVGVPGNIPTNEAGNGQSITISQVNQMTKSNQMRESAQVTIKYCPKCGLRIVNNKNGCQTLRKKQ